VSSLERARSSDPRIPVPPQLALRVALIGGLSMLMFGLIFFRLWYLQVLSGEQYVQQADITHGRKLPVAAPRGEILDRSGAVIATSKTSNAVEIVPEEMPAAVREQVAAYGERLKKAVETHQPAREALLRYERKLERSGRAATTRETAHEQRLQKAAAIPLPPIPPLKATPSGRRTRHLFDHLARVIEVPARTIDELVVQGMETTPYANVTVKTDAGTGALTELGERQIEFPGVIQRPVSLREYPHDELAAQVLGHVGLISEPELKLKAFEGVKPGTVVGKEDLEFYYDRYLGGTPGVERIEVNAEGTPVPGEVTITPPKSGHSVKLTLDLGLEQEGEKALREGIENAHAGGKPATGGAFVAMDPRNGEVLAIGSYPGFDPNRFAKPLTPSEYAELTGGGPEGGRLVDRAVDGQYPTGSTFKPITALAALEAGVITPEEGLGAGSCILANAEEFCNAGHADYGAVGLVQALKVSSDTYFFEVGKLANEHGGDIIQKKALELGIGRETGIDLPNEFPGVIPTPKWRREQNKAEEQCQAEKHVPSCGIVSEIREWTVGDDMHLAVGQGDLLTDPLQMAVAYSTIANAYTHDGEGTVVTPHLGLEIDEPTGGLLQSLSAPPKRHVHLNPTDVNLVMQGLHEAASQPQGTSAEVWAGWDQEQLPVFGKTGTAQHAGKVDQSWYMCYIGSPSHPIVIAVTVEQGGFGAETAAPIARLIASKWYGKPEKFVAGSSKTL
jgi:penicillin-binding protein 2